MSNEEKIKRIRYARQLLKLNQEELGELVGKSQQQIAKIENGRIKNIDSSIFAKALNVPVEWIVEGRNAPDWLEISKESGLSATDLENLTHAIQVVIDAMITSNPKISDAAKIEVLTHAPIMQTARMIRAAFLDRCKTKEDLEKLFPSQTS